ncbi:MAG: tyrosine-type recombinase/integrase, partial [Halalkalicoccus sp.]
MSSADRGEVPDDPIAYFIEDITFQGKSARTREAYERALRRFERFLADPDRNPRGEPIGPRAASHRECMAFIHSLRGDLAESTVASYAAYLHRFYAYMTQVGAFDANPMALVIEEMDESIDKDPARREISIEAMRRFVAGIRHPLDRAVVLTLLKTGMRAGELCNLDLRDFALSDPELDEAYELGSRAALDNRPRSLYVSSEPAVGTVVNGAERSATNKRKRDTVIPVDDELAAVLKAWLAIRPDAVCESEPLFLSTRDDWGQRLDP